MGPVNGSLTEKGLRGRLGAADRPNLIRVMPAKGCSCRLLVRGGSRLDPEQQSEIPQGPPRRAELVIVGGGLAGLICAWRGAEAGFDVVVCDSPDRPAAAEVAAGMIAPVGEASWGEAEALAAGLAAAASWPEFAELLGRRAGLPVPYRRCGSLHVALDRDEAAELRRRSELSARHQLPARELLGSECRRLEPGLAPEVTAGISAPEEAEVDPRALLAALRSAARAAGAKLIATEVAEVGRTVQLTDGSRIDAERIAICAGAWAGAERLLGPSQRLPVRPLRGEVVRLKAPAGGLPCERIVVGERFYVVPRLSGEVVLGATSEERGFDLRVSAGGVHELLRECYRALPEIAELELVEVAAGLRPGSPDNAPIFGSLDARDGGPAPIVAAGLHRHGILLAPLLASGFDALLAGEQLPAELGPFGAERFLRSGEVESVG
jgi:glycine oxidase